MNVAAIEWDPANLRHFAEHGRAAAGAGSKTCFGLVAIPLEESLSIAATGMRSGASSTVAPARVGISLWWLCPGQAM